MSAVGTQLQAPAPCSGTCSKTLKSYHECTIFLFFLCSSGIPSSRAVRSGSAGTAGGGSAAGGCRFLMGFPPCCVPVAVGTAPGHPSPSSVLVAGNVRVPSERCWKIKTRGVGGKPAVTRPGGVRNEQTPPPPQGLAPAWWPKKMGGCHGNAPIPLGLLPSRSVEARGARGCTGGQGIAPRPPSGGVATIFIYILRKRC